MCDFKFKIVIVGDMGVGKSALFTRFWEDSFPMDYKPTMVAKTDVKLTEVTGKKGLLELWDASGDKIDHKVLRRVYRNAHGFIIVYDTTLLTSFSNVGFWLQELVDFGRKGINIMLVGSKYDEKEKREVTQEMAFNYAKQHGLSFMEASAKSGDYVKDVFNTMLLDVYNRLGPQPWTWTKEADNGDRQQDEQDKADKEQSDGDGDGNGDVLA